MRFFPERELEQRRLCTEGRNCWRLLPANSVAFLVDGAAYFDAFVSAAELACQSIIIVGWDLNSRVRLVHDERPRDLPREFKGLLNALTARRKELHIYILLWDFAMLYVWEREFLPIVANGWRTHRQIHFAVDGHHPVGASHHQKIVVVDDAVAFVGGLDLTRSRWDTPEHRADDPRRVDKDGQPYAPFHDVQMLVDGKAAQGLGELARTRWKRATGQDIALSASTLSNPWPPHLRPDLESVPVAIARTEPAYNDHPAVNEIETLYCDAIAAAQRSIYIENQYLTSAVISNALAARLQEPQGPDIVLVLPHKASGWLEESTMDVLRARLLRRLRAADRFQRLRMYCPVVPGLDTQCLNVHSKVLIVDDQLIRIGSSNLSNRSMGLDTECDLAIEAVGEVRISEAITRFLARLLGEHLDVPPEMVVKTLSISASLTAAVDYLRGRERTLDPLDGVVPEWLDKLVPESTLIDPERPIDPDTLITTLIHPRDRKPGRRALMRGAAVVLILLGLAATWRWTPLAEWITMDTVNAWAAFLRESSSAPLLVMAAYLVGSLVLVPVTSLIVVTALIFGPFLGFLYAFAGCLLGAMLTYGVGAFFGKDLVRHFAGPRLNRFSKRLARHGVLAVITVRVIPVAPFTIVNMMAGVSHIRLRDFLLGTVLGMGPGIFALTFFTSQLENTVRAPTVESFLLLIGLVVLLVFITSRVYQWLARN
jgi:phospholipase D1/2